MTQGEWMVHTRARRTLAGLLTVATASTAVLTSGSAAAAPPSTATTTPGALTTVTLVTGDVVTLGGPDGVDVHAAGGREHIGFRTQKDVEGDLHVIPADALALVSSGRLDPRLFDVSELARSGYGDADREDLPLIVDYPGATPRSAGARAVRELPSMSAVAMRAEKSPTFWETARTSVSKIWLDGRVKASLEHSVPQIGAPEAWAAGYTGAGTTVAVLDSGIDVTHPDLDDAVADAQDFTGSESGTDDQYGHGTHVASIITGDGEVNKGVAPDAKLLNGKVLDDWGGGYESSIIAGMEWAATNGADVINMSLGSPFPDDGTDPMAQAVNRLSAETGALFVIAAGNTGPGAESVGSPGTADAALTVGAVDRADQLAEFSGRGPRLGDGAIKPDITAPGVDITAANATSLGGGYAAHSGTSMAAPHVAGAAAILAGQHPDWTGDQLKATLMSSADPNPDLSVFEQGAGRVDVAAATEASLTASRGSISFGTAQWPHHDDQSVARTVTYTNSGTAPVTLDVTAQVTGPDGNAAPAGMFTVSPAQVTVPAGGSADVTVTADTRAGTVDGSFSGTLVATGGGTTLRTPVAVHREVESYDVKINLLDRDGNPTSQYGLLIFDYATPSEYRPYDESGTVTIRLPKGTYYFGSTVLTGFRGLNDMNEPKIVVDAAAEYTFDARDAVPVTFTVDRPEATAAWADLTYLLTTEWAVIPIGWELQNFDDVLVRPSRTTAPGDFEFSMAAKIAKPDGTGEGYGYHASPYLYNLKYAKDGSVPADLTRHVPDSQLARVVSSHAVATPGMIGVRERFLTMPLPFTLTEFYSPDTEWRPNFYDTIDAGGFPDGIYNSAEPRTYQLGRTARERWNVGVFGPRFSFDPTISLTLTGRLGDHLQFSAGLYSDGNPDTHGSTPAFTSANTEILRDGAVIGEYGAVGYIDTELPPEEATYTVRTTATRPGSLSTRIDGEWTFRSAHTEGDQPTPIPALAVRFAPNLDDHNAAQAGRKFRFPVYVQRNAADDPGAVSTPVVEISHDDGATWQPVRITRHHDQWQAEVNHPRNAEFASLRWSISDPAGNTAKATVIHAYALKK
jgi:subtilisin family serine protease